jgi:hypothetical protein
MSSDVMPEMLSRPTEEKSKAGLGESMRSLPLCEHISLQDLPTSMSDSSVA